MTSFHSVKSIKGLIRLILGLTPPAHCFHQTLTFKENVQDAFTAKQDLQNFLDVMHKTFAMASFYVMEQQDRGSFHFHVVFFIYDASQLSASPDAATKLFRAEAYRRWDRITNKTGVRAAQKLTRISKDFATVSYWFRDGAIKPLPPNLPHPRTGPNWWGVRNSDLIEANSRKVSNEEVNTAYWNLISVPVSKPTSDHARIGERTFYGRKEIQRLKDMIEDMGKDWEVLKRQRTGRSGKVSDEDFAIFLNRDELQQKQKNAQQVRRIVRNIQTL